MVRLTPGGSPSILHETISSFLFVKISLFKPKLNSNGSKWAQLLEQSPQVTRINCCFPFCVLSRPILFPWRQILPFRQCHRCLRDGHKVSSGVCAKPPKTCNQQAAVCVLLESFVCFTCFIFSHFLVAFIYIMKNKTPRAPDHASVCDILLSQLHMHQGP